MKKKIAVLFFLVILILAPTFTAHGYEKDKAEKSKSKEGLYNQLELFADAISIIRSEYVDDVDAKKLIYGAMRGMMSSLDDFSQFMEPDEYNELKLETKGEFGGIGVEISLRDGILTIIAPIAGTPAEEGGIQPGDKIVKIDGKLTKNINLNEAVKQMRGKPGTMLTLTIWREKEHKILDIPIKRAVITIRSIKRAELIEGKTGYIKLVEFQENTPRDLEEALKKLDSEGMDALILDLRNNPGGLLDGAVRISEDFLPKDKVIVSIKARNPSQNMVFKSSGKYTHPNYPIIVIVNEGSASASEIVAGAIQDDKRGIVLGTKTFGKASVQTIIPMKDGSALRITSASYLTPSGKTIRGQGIIPDVVVEKEESKTKEKPESAEIFEKLEEKEAPPPAKELTAKELILNDNQLGMAVNMIKGLKAYKAEKN